MRHGNGGMMWAQQRPIFWPLLVAGIIALVGMGELPIGYYTFLRWVLSIAAVALAVVAAQYRQFGWLGLAVPVFALWFPPFQVFFDKSVWVVLDLIAGVGLILAGALLTKPEVREETTLDGGRQ